MKWFILCFTGAVMLCAGVLYAHDPATHMYIGYQTFDVWQDFDPEFYSALCEGNTNTGVFTRKFYYLGLILPDMVDTVAQLGTRELITELYENLPEDSTITLDYTFSQNILGVWIRLPVTITATVKMKSNHHGLKIQDHTYNNVQDPMYFNGNFPNTNLAKLKEMVDYAKSQGWTPQEKALIYGAYMHVIHDLYAHMVLQPSLFGHAYAIESDSAAGKGLLEIPECYYEALTATHIGDWNFIDDVYAGWDYHFQQWRDYPYSFFGYGADPYIFLDWQLHDFDAVEKFIESAQAKNYAGANLTQERLESYMHGWAILLYMMYGYDENGSPGGIFRHYSWNAKDILKFIGEPFLKHFEVTNVDVSGNAGHLGDIVIDLVTDALLWRGLVFHFIDPTSYARDYFLKDPLMLIQRVVHIASGNEDIYDQPWPYFLTPNGLNDVIGYASGWDNDSVATSYLWTIKREINTWDLYNQYPYYPFKREFYEGELTRSLDLDEQYKQSIRSGATYLDYTPGTIARKSGILGGMYPIEETRDYNKQPGVFDMHFEFDGDYVYTQTPLPMQGDPPLVDLRYDLMTSGVSEARVFLDNGATPLNWVRLPGLSRQKSFLSGALDQVGEVSFEVRSGEKTSNPTQFCRMFTSDYRDAYNSHWEINGNSYYQTLFNGGDPVREMGEDPLANPKSYWPYVLSVTEGSGYYLYAPSNLLAYLSPIYDDGGRLRYYKLQLYWTDNSTYEHGQQIWENDYLHRTVGPNVTTFTKTLPNKPSTSWSYKVRAYRDEGYYSHFSNTVTVTIPSGGGCPFIYTFNGSEFVEDNNILAGSDVDSGEVTEYYKLEQSPMREENRYFLQVREFEQEHTYLDKIELMAIDHPCGVKVGVATEGDIVIYDNEVLPIDCADTLGQSHLALILERDSTYFQGFPGDELIIDFGETEVNSEDALHFVIVDKVEPPASVMVSIYKDGDWHRVGRLLHRRNWWSQMVYPLEEGSLDSLKVKLTWYEEQKLDYVALAKAESEQFITKKCPLLSATHSDIGSVKQKLLTDDENYAELLPGDTITLEFAVVDIEPGWVRDFVFVSNGYYITETGGGSQTAYSNIPVLHSLSLYPNPARNDMAIRFGIPREERVSLKIYDISGREIKMLVDGRLEAGYHIIRLDGRNLPSGIYFARLVTDNYEATKKLVLMK